MFNALVGAMSQTEIILLLLASAAFLAACWAVGDARDLRARLAASDQRARDEAAREAKRAVDLWAKGLVADIERTGVRVAGLEAWREGAVVDPPGPAAAPRERPVGQGAYQVRSGPPALQRLHSDPPPSRGERTIVGLGAPPPGPGGVGPAQTGVRFGAGAAGGVGR